MGTLHYAVIQEHNPPNEYRKHHSWSTIALFEFDKDYELFRWLHSQKPGNVYYANIEDYPGLPDDFDDMYYYQVFFEDDLFVDGVLVNEFRYENYPDGSNGDSAGQPSYRFEALIAAFKLIPGRKRIVICQDQ
jgi:hypothetical protein